jgi:hypothetical protein
MRVPSIAGPIPPPGCPTAPGVCVRNSKLKAGKPFLITSIRMLPKGIMAITTQIKPRM